MKDVANVGDLQILAKRRLPRMFYDYIDSGSWTESTYRSNSCDLSSIGLRQRIATGVGHVRELRTKMLDCDVSMPVALAPVGLVGMFWPDGEIVTARAAARFGLPFTLSTMSICSIEDIAANLNSPFWFQLYLMRDRDFVSRLIDRARDAGCDSIVLTLDLPVPAQRHKDVRNRISIPPRLNLRNLVHLASCPRWCLNMLGTRRRSFGNIVGHAKGVGDMSAFWAWTAKQFDPAVSWSDVAWVRERWKGKLVVKGVMDGEDARLAVLHGADALIVSNHGGRQLDGAKSSISALPEIVSTVGKQVEVHMDGGIRSGQDVLRALALGASGVFIGRSYLYGLAAAGEDGVTKCLELIHNELDLTMALCGINDIRWVDKAILASPLALQSENCRCQCRHR
jgi:L-lactate dehydrogenase (cytochrome)